MEIREGGLDDPRVHELLRYHLATVDNDSPPEYRHALDLDGLRELDFFTAWNDGELAGMGALKEFAPGHSEVKSMRTAPGHLRRGVARAMLNRLVARARERGCTRISLETGTSPQFAPANALYERHGFIDCAPFAEYPASPHNRFMTMKLP